MDQFGPVSDFGPAPSSLQAAQAQAAQLRALHSAVRLAAQGQLPAHHHAHSNSIHEFLSTIRTEDIIPLQKTSTTNNNNNNTAGLVSPNSVADSAIRPHFNEYPVFMPSHDDVQHLQTATDISISAVPEIGGLGFSARRSSVDHADFHLREERLQYILDHDIKSTFSASSKSARQLIHDAQFPKAAGNVLLNPAAADITGLLKYQTSAVHEGAAPPPAAAAAPPRATNWITSLQPLTNNDAVSGAAPQLMKNGTYVKQYNSATKPHPTEAGRQKALSEFLTEEIARRKAFSELAAVDTTAAVEALRSKNKLISGYNNQSSLIKTSGNYEFPAMEAGEAVTGKVIKFAPEGAVSCEKCRPAGPKSVRKSDSNQMTGSNHHEQPSSKVVKESAQKPAAFKALGWFSRGMKSKKNSGARSMSSGLSEQLNNMDCSSQVCSSLINGAEAEKELEVAMAMDLMELKVMQAQATRDAAVAEVADMRVAMESMGKKLADVERSCLDLRTQLAEVRETEFCNEELEFQDQISRSEFDTASMVSEKLRFGGARPATPLGLVIVNSAAAANREQQPSKADFCSAVSEARLGVKQLSRVLVQLIHVNDSKNHGGGGGSGAALKQMVEEKLRTSGYAAGTGGSGSRTLRYQLESVLNAAFYESFENVGFDKSGSHKVLEPSQRALAFFHASLKLAKLSCTQLLAQASPLYDPAFDLFCSRKMRTIGRAVGCPVRFWPDDLTRCFLAAARAVWILHHVAFSFHVASPTIFRVACNAPFDDRFMDQAVPASNRRHVAGAPPPARHFVVSFMVMPGFFVQDDVIKSKVVAT